MVTTNVWNMLFLKKLLFKFKGHQNPVFLFALKAHVSEEPWSGQR